MVDPSWSLSFKSAKNIEYYYKMEGIDDEWQMTTALRKEYPQLLPGNYNFQLKAVDTDGVKTPKNISYLKKLSEPRFLKYQNLWIVYMLIF